MKNNKGITLIVLIITIIILLILTSIATYTGMEAYQNSRVIKFITQMQLIQTKVDSIYEKGEGFSLLGEYLTQEQQNEINEITENTEYYTTNQSNLKYFSETDIIQDLDLENISDDIVINFETREVFSLTGIEYEGNTYYTQYDLPSGQKLVSYDNSVITQTININKRIDGLTAYISITGIKKGILKYKKLDSQNWQTLTNYIEEEKEYNITESGEYKFKIDDTEIEQTTKITLVNSPKLETGMSKVKYNQTTSQFTITNDWNYDYSETSEKWAYSSKTEGDNIIYSLWIPRFVYKSIEDINEIKFIKGNSTVLTDNTSIDNTYTVPTYFEENPYSTGFWKEVTPSSELDLINLLSQE